MQSRFSNYSLISLGALFTLSICPSVSTQGPKINTHVREELIQLQTQEGLTLASFSRGIEFVNFSDRSRTQTNKPFAPGKAEEKRVEGEGAISRDGTEIAFDLHEITHNPPRLVASLGIFRSDGSGFQQFSNIRTPSAFCWSSDKSSLVVSIQVPATQYKPTHLNMVLLNLETKETQEIAGGMVTSQCWSADGKHIVYESDGSIGVYDFETKDSRILARGKDPTWSSDGRLAFLDDDTYYAISLTGEGREVLFNARGALSGLWWSPDCRIVAYISRNGPLEGSWWKLMDVGIVRLRVRRLSDDSEDWVAEMSDVHVPDFQWVTNPGLLK